ncbi:helix-turn-helix domain-containing protein [Mesorhizobium sp. BR1-1-16]|uniref:helix-turn-helix domain-containing protein n=1 Tax=Mesorhizobium sp. BR1-1-16 TaxID=2876653 RepID=UPI001CCA437E|nr:helix-turn-helix domain-containing protein [Mesorhizobium sp. BR1-1-16]MBZ9939195.1 helix-turn-helix domain-containing protein [Mesorhizobium sp. BR1-1-16]
MTGAAAQRRPERVRAPVAATILGIEVRTVQALAARGELPGAAKVGKLWTFDETALRLWIKERSACPKDQEHQSTPTGGAIRYGRDLPLQVANSVKASEQALRKLRQSGSQR